MGIKKGLILLGMILVLSGIGWGLNCEGYEENNCYTLTDLGPGTLVCSKYSEVLDKFAMQCGQKWPLEDFQDIIGVNYGFGDVSCNVIHNMGAIFNQFTYSFNEEKELGQVIIIAGVSCIGPALKDVSIEVIFYNGAEKVGSEVFGLETSCNKDE